MVDSGIKCHNHCHDIFQNLEKKKLEYVIMKIDKHEGKGPETVVVVDSAEFGQSDKEMTDEEKKLLKYGETPAWHIFSKKIKTYPIAFGSCYVTYRSKDQRDTYKLPFVFWCSESAKVGDKMKYSSTKLATGRKLKSVCATVQCGDDDEISFREIVGKVSKGDLDLQHHHH